MPGWSEETMAKPFASKVLRMEIPRSFSLSSAISEMLGRKEVEAIAANGQSTGNLSLSARSIREEA